jgi:hypothetical protein
MRIFACLSFGSPFLPLRFIAHIKNSVSVNWRFAMRAAFCLAMLCFGCFSIHSSAAQQTTSALPTVTQQRGATADPNAKAMAMVTQALTGAATASINDVTLTGTARRIVGADDETGTAKVKALATGETRMDLSFPSGTLSEVRVNGEKGPVGHWQGPDAVRHAIPYHNLMLDSAWFFPALMLHRFSSTQDFILSYTGNETRDGRVVEHVTVNWLPDPRIPARAAALMQHATQIEIYLDVVTHLPSSISFNSHPDNDAKTDIPTEIRFSDYHAVNGVQVPFRVQKFLNNGLLLDLQLDAAALNTGLSASDFSQ